MRKTKVIFLVLSVLSVSAHAIELFSDDLEDGTLNAWSSQLAGDVSNVDDGTGTNRVGQIAHGFDVRSGLGNQDYAGFSELQFEVELQIRALSLPAGGDAAFVLGRDYYSAGLQQTYALDIDANSSGAGIRDAYRIVVNNDIDAVLDYDGGLHSVAPGRLDLFRNGSLIVDDGVLADNNIPGEPARSFGFIINAPEPDMTIQFDNVVIRNFKAPHVPTNYVVSTTGSDLNPGTLAAPFRTIAHAASLMDTGDTLWIRGGTYREEVVWDGIAGSNGAPLVVSAFSNESVVLSGMQTISNAWTQHSGDIYKTTVSNDIWQLLVDGKEMVPARWPNAFLDDSLSPTVYSHDGFEGCTTFSENGEPVIGGDGDVVLNPGDVLMDTNGNVVVRTDENLPGDVVGAVAVMNIGSWSSWARTITEQVATNEFIFQPQIATNQLNAREQVFFLEGKLNYLDAQTEWFYDSASKTVYLWMKGGGAPSGLIEGKVQSYAFTFSNCTHVELRGIDFYGTTLKMENCVDALIEDCDFDFPHTSRRMLGEPEAVNITSMNVDRDEWAPGRITLRNCSMRETDGPAIEMRGYGNVIENCAFERIDWTGAHGGGATFEARKSPGLLFRRNTVKTTGASEGVGCPKSVKVLNRNGDYLDVEPWMIAPYVTYEDLYPSLLELNHLSEMGKVQSDGAHIQAGSQQIPGLMYRYNWAYVSDKNGLRFDGGGGWDSAPPGVEGTQHHNVVFGTRKQSVKGDREYCFNNTCFDSSQQDIYVGGDYPRFNAFNTRSKTGNNACNTISYSFNGANGVFPGEATNNYIGGLEGVDVKTLLVDSGQFDFRPKAGTPLVDGGVIEHGYTMEHFTNFLAPELFVDGLPTGNVLAYTNGITDGYAGAAPDIGAYEYGSPSYWIPGRQAVQASHPIPTDGAAGQPADRDLIYLIGYKGESANIHFGTDPGFLSLLTSQSDPTNVVAMIGLEGETTYYWRVDTVLADSSIVTGEVWSFTTAQFPYTTSGSDAPGGNIVEFYDGESNGMMGPRRQVSTNLHDRTSGQTFTLSSMDSVDIAALTIKINHAVDFSANDDPHTFLLAFMKDTDSNGKTDSPVGETYTFDLTGQDVADAGDYITFHLGHPLTNLPSGTYSFEMYFGEEHDGNNFLFRRMQGTGSYAGGGQISKSVPPGFPNANLYVSPVNDFIFFLHGTGPASGTFEYWIDAFGLSGAQALRLADVEPDGLDNLLEYAFGGNPTNDDAVSVVPSHEVDGNWFKYIYRRRSDYAVRGLTYTVEAGTNLVPGVWSTDGVVETGSETLDAGFDSVTNRVPVDDKKEQFLRLKIEG